MRNPGLALAGLLALSTTMVAYADPLAPAGAGAAPAIVRVWGSGSGQRSAPDNQHRTFGYARQWIGGWVPRCRGQSGGWVSYCRTGLPTFWLWVPGGGSFDYPFADWRGPTGGWGNP